jgi:hypothetical protein
MTIKEIAIKTIHQLLKMQMGGHSGTYQFCGWGAERFENSMKEKALSVRVKEEFREWLADLVSFGSTRSRDIVGFIAEDSPSAARRFAKTLLQVVERLADSGVRRIARIQRSSYPRMIRRP